MHREVDELTGTVVIHSPLTDRGFAVIENCAWHSRYAFKDLSPGHRCCLLISIAVLLGSPDEVLEIVGAAHVLH